VPRRFRSAPGPLQAFPTRFALALALVLTTVIGSVVLLNVIVESKLASAQRVQLTLADPPSGGGANYLLIGSDSRDFVQSSDDAGFFGDQADAGGNRSDTIMVLHTDPESGRALLVSFPRDLWVDVPGHGKSRINTAFNDGPQELIDTLAQNFDVPINHYAAVNFESFAEIVDAIGHIPVLFPTAARDKFSGLGIPWPGCAALDGGTSLALVRARHLELLNLNTGKWEPADQIPDIGRIGRQQAFLRELGARAMDAALSSPFKADEIAQSAVDHLTIDQDFGRGDVFALADGLAGQTEGGAGPESLTVPADPATHDGQEVLEPASDADALMERLRNFDIPVPDPASVSPEDTRVKVLNASGVNGAAGSALKGLKTAGFKGAGTGNADRQLQTSEVHYPPGKENEAALVATFVTGPVEVVSDDKVTNADATLWVGRSFSGIATAPAPGTEAVSQAPVPGGC
jgi:LCP family protein required for cell wall assembly